MLHQCSVAVYPSFEDAKVGIQALCEAGYPRKQVSLITHDVEHKLPHDEVPQSGSKTIHDLTKGAVAGGLLGALLATPLLAIPGIGLAIFAGPLATGTIVGGFLGGMAGWGVHEDHVRQYEEKVKHGRVLVVANGDPAQVAEAHRIFRGTNVEEAHLHATTGDQEDD